MCSKDVCKKSNIKLIIAYDGGCYLGWQKTAMGPSIEETLEDTLRQILQESVYLQAASRTDAGVHAKGQVVNFLTAKQNLCLQRLKVSLNCLLPKDIAVMHIEEEKEDFHATLHCQGKEYHYSLCYGTAQLPQVRHFSWHYPHTLNVDTMRTAAQLLIGEHNFSAFCNVRKSSAYQNYVRTLYQIELLELPDYSLRIEIKGNHFLYKMVRNIVGTLVYVGCQKIALKSIPAILASHARPEAGMTAPAHGLCLFKVFYEPFPL